MTKIANSKWAQIAVLLVVAIVAGVVSQLLVEEDRVTLGDNGTELESFTIKRSVVMPWKKD